MQRRSDCAALVTIFLAACVLHGPAIVRGRVLLPADVVLLMRPWGLAARDRFPEFRFTQNQMLGPIFEYYSWRYQARERLRAGEVPLWNPMEMSGNVLLANSQSAVLYPPNLLLYVLPLWLGINLVTLLHTVITGLLMYAFLRALGLSPVAGLTGSLAWMLSGPMLVWTEFQTPTATLCWLPGVLWAWERTIRHDGRNPWRGCVLAAVFLALTATAGHPQFAFYVMLASVAYMLWRSPRRALWAVPATIIAAFVLGGATLFPVAEASRINHRSSKTAFEASVKLRLPPEYLVGLLLPNILGNPRDYVKIVDGEPQPGNPYIGKYDFIEYCHYAGVAVLILALLALFGAFAAAHVRFFAVLALLGLALALGTWVGAPFYYLVPGYSQFHAPARAVCLLVFALCVLAAFGVQTLAEAGSTKLETASVGSRRIGRLAVCVAVTCGVTAALAWPLMGLVYKDVLASGWIAYEAAGLRHAVLVAALAGVLAWTCSTSGSRFQRVALAGVPLLCAADLLVWGSGFNPATDPAMLGGTPEVTHTLRQSWPRRVLSLETPGIGIKSLIVPNYNAVVGYREVQGADSVHSLRYHLALETVAEQMSPQRPAFPDGNTIRLRSADHPLLDALDVALVTTAPPTALPPSRFQRMADAELTVWRNPRAKGPAWIVGRAVPVAGPVEAVQRLQAADFDIGSRATVEGPQPQVDERASGSVRMVHFSAHRVIYDVQASGRGILVTSEPAYPGWRAIVETDRHQREAPIIVANGILRSVVVPPGRCRVIMTYAPASYCLGLYLSCIGTGLLAAVLAAGVTGWVSAAKRCREEVRP